MKPFLKWVGGKTRMLAKVAHLLPRVFNTYHEPFLGGGAFLFHLQPERAVVSDVQRDLIQTYTHLRDSPEEVITALEYLKSEHDAEFFYDVREAFRDDLDSLTPRRAACFIYLNCKCYNGLCRYNKKGQFNAPLHKLDHMKRCIPTRKALQGVSAYLQKVDIVESDFRCFTTNPLPGDFILIDPPYWPYWEQGFTGYTGDGFKKEDQWDLVRMFNQFTDTGVMAMLWNSDVPAIHELYDKYDRHPFSVKNCVGQKSYDGKKKSRSELCILNYDPKTLEVMSG